MFTEAENFDVEFPNSADVKVTRFPFIGGSAVDPKLEEYDLFITF